MIGAGSAFAAAVAARVDGLHGDIQAALDGWAREQRAHWDQLRTRLTALSVQMMVAQRECQRRVGRTPARREQARAALSFIAAWDLQRQHIEDAVWAELRQARADEARLRAAVIARAAELGALGRSLAAQADGVLAESTAAVTGESPLGPAIRANVARALAELRAGLERLGARAEADAARVAGAGVPDFTRALAHFDAELAARVGGGGAAVAPVRPRRAAVIKARKQARVPKFLLQRFYKNGGMRTAGDGLEIVFTNPLAFCIIQGGDAIVVDGRPHPRERTFLDNGQRRIDANGFSDTSYLKFPKGGELRVTLDGLQVKPGRHHIACALELRKMGWVELNVEDSVS
jgi:hypothetical protein